MRETAQEVELKYLPTSLFFVGEGRRDG